MEWFASAERGGWIRDRVVEFGEFNSMLPAGFEAYAKILPPLEAYRADGVDKWGAAIVAEEAQWRWADVARRNGRILTQEPDWAGLVGGERSDAATWDDGWTVPSPQEGFLEPALLGELIRISRPFTTTPDDVTIAVWEGWGFGGSGTAYLITDDDHDDEGPPPAMRDFLKESVDATDPLLRRMDETQRRPGPMLELPYRNYVLAATTTGELSDPDWVFRAGLGWVKDGFSGQTPQLVWPSDQAWCIATEIDLPETYIAGPHDLIEMVTRSADLETLRVYPD